MKSILKKILLMIRPVVSCKISFGPESTEANVALVAATHCKQVKLKFCNYQPRG